jgi:hypothetical protein
MWLDGVNYLTIEIYLTVPKLAKKNKSFTTKTSSCELVNRRKMTKNEII